MLFNTQAYLYKYCHLSGSHYLQQFNQQNELGSKREGEVSRTFEGDVLHQRKKLQL